MIQEFLIPLKIEDEVVRATLSFDETGTKGVIKLDRKHVVSFELQTPWAVANYFTAEKLTTNQLRDIVGIHAEPVDTGFRP